LGFWLWTLGFWLWALGFWLWALGLGVRSWAWLGRLTLGSWEFIRRVLFVPEKFCVVARIHDRPSVTDLDDLRRQLFHEIAVVRDDDQGAAVVLERSEQIVRA